jgi:hypothetical protein
VAGGTLVLTVPDRKSSVDTGNLGWGGNANGLENVGQVADRADVSHVDPSQRRPHSQGNESVADPVGADRDHADDREATSVGLGAEEVHVGDLLGGFFVG